MKARPILFSGDMVRAILDGRKTQTRRIIKGWHLNALSESVGFEPSFAACAENNPPFLVGDLLWARETCAQYDDGLVFRASTPQLDGVIKWKPSIFMPKHASRITLEVIGLRAERLQDISEADAIAEGITMCESGYFWWNVDKQKNPSRNAIGAYRDLWQSINGAGSWDANPWVWVIEFKPHFVNVNALQYKGGE